MGFRIKQQYYRGIIIPRFIYHNALDARIWNTDGRLNKLVSNALQMVAWEYIAYIQRIGFPLFDECVRDIFVHGSTTNYYYDDTSDIDICIVADMDKMYETFPGVDVYTLMKNALGAWLRNYRIKICGRGIDIEFVDVKTPKYGPNIYKVGSAYSILNDKWIRRPQLLRGEQIRAIRRDARKKFREIRAQYRKIQHDEMADNFIETFLMRMSHERKESYANNFLQPVTADTMAFRMARRARILGNLKERAARQRSRNFNVLH